MKKRILLFLCALLLFAQPVLAQQGFGGTGAPPSGFPQSDIFSGLSGGIAYQQVAENAAGNGVGFVYGINGVQTVSANTVLTNASPSYNIATTSGNTVQFTLPVASTCVGKIFYFVKSSVSFASTIVTQASDNIDASTNSITIGGSTGANNPYAVILISTGTNQWSTISRAFVPVVGGGLGGNITFNSGGFLYASTGSLGACMAAAGTAGSIVLGQGASAPTYSSGGTKIDASGDVFLGKGQVVNRTTVSNAGYTTLATDYIVAYTSLSAGQAVSLSSANAATNQVYIIKDESGNAGADNITCTPSSGTIDGAANKVINAAYGVLRVYYNGANWFTF
jgi:hypothetical protein